LFGLVFFSSFSSYNREIILEKKRKGKKKVTLGSAEPHWRVFWWNFFFKVLVECCDFCGFFCLFFISSDSFQFFFICTGLVR